MSFGDFLGGMIPKTAGEFTGESKPISWAFSRAFCPFCPVEKRYPPRARAVITRFQGCKWSSHKLCIAIAAVFQDFLSLENLLSQICAVHMLRTFSP
jgi:hypothetical protein